MFNRVTRADLNALRTIIDTNYEIQRKEFWSLQDDLNKLVDALSMTKDERHINRYIRKGGPERGDD